MQLVADDLNPPAAAAAAGAALRPMRPSSRACSSAGGHLQRALLLLPRRRRPRHADTWRGCRVTLAPSLAGSPRVNGHRDYVVKALLHGLTGPSTAKTYPQVMVPDGRNQDQWIADVASYVRNSFGNTGWFVTTAGCRAGPHATADRKTQWTAEELVASLPRLLVADATWRGVRESR